MFANKPARLLVVAERASMCLSDNQLHGSLNSKRLNILLTSLISMTKFNQFDKPDMSVDKTYGTGFTILGRCK